MSLNSAQLFVSKMRGDKDFREKVKNVSDKEVLWNLVKSEGFDFDEKDLVGTMAACIRELEETSSRD